MYPHAYSSLADLFATPGVQTPTEGVLGAAPVPTKFVHLFVFPEHPYPPERASPVSNYTFGDESLAILFGSQNPQQPDDMVGESADTESQPSQELINNMDKGGRLQHFNQSQG